LPKSKAIEKREPTEIIPTLEMPDFSTAVVKVESYQVRVRELEAEIRALKIVDGPTRTRAGELVTELKGLENKTEVDLKPFKAQVKTVSDYINKKGNAVYDLSEDLRKNTLNPMMGAWDELEEKRAQAERDRVAREKEELLKREAEVQRQKDLAAAKERKQKRVAEIRADLQAKRITLRESEKLLREAGANEEADKAAAAAKEQEGKKAAAEAAAKVEVAPNVPSIQGNVRRKNPKFKVVNAQKVKLKYLKPDEVEIGKVVRGATYESDEDVKRIEEEIGGIEIEFERTY
jgi:trichohyalin